MKNGNNVNLSKLGTPSTDTCFKKSTPANILELPSVKTYDGMITSTSSLPKPIEHITRIKERQLD
jgi:hypothetical protein